MVRRRAYPLLGKNDTQLGMWLTLYAGHIYQHHTFIKHQEFLKTNCSDYFFRVDEGRISLIQDASGTSSIPVDSIHTWPEIQGQAIYRRQLGTLKAELRIYVKVIADLAAHFFPGTVDRERSFSPEELIHTMLSYSHEDVIDDTGEPTGTWLLPMEALSRADVASVDRHEYSEISGWPEQRIRPPKWEGWVQPTKGLLNYVTGRSASRYSKRLSLEKVALDLLHHQMENHTEQLTYEHLWTEMKTVQSAFGILGTRRTPPPQLSQLP